MVAAGHPSRRPEAAACNGAAGVPLGRGDCDCGQVAVRVTLDTEGSSDGRGRALRRRRRGYTIQLEKPLQAQDTMIFLLSMF